MRDGGGVRDGEGGWKGRVSDHKQFEFAERKILVMIKEYYFR